MPHSSKTFTPQFLKFAPNLKSVIWGGTRIAAFKGIAAADSHVGESWEVSGLEGRESVISGGTYNGFTLRELLRRHGAEIMGERVWRRHGAEFPLLIKLIDANDNLSIQVHPDDDLARRRHGCRGKAEMWYVIDAAPGASLMAGMSRTVTPAEYLRHLNEGSLLQLIASHSTHPGDIFFLPAGRIHSIGAGNLIYEVQQASDITYRLYDYDRRDRNGNKRELHTDLALEALDFTVSNDCKRHYPAADALTTLVKSIFFNVKRLNVDGGSTELPMPHDAFLCLTCIAGDATLTAPGGSTATLRQGETVLAPAVFTRLTVTGNTTILTATV